jgi:hypothetical protein
MEGHVTDMGLVGLAGDVASNVRLDESGGFQPDDLLEYILQRQIVMWHRRLFQIKNNRKFVSRLGKHEL